MLSLFNGMNQRKFARLAGLMYLGLILLGIAGHLTRVGFIEADDAAATAENIMDNELKWAAANVSWLISEMFLLFLGLMMYNFLKPVNKPLAQLMLLFVVVGVAIECLNTVNLFAALTILGGAEYLHVFTEEQLYAQAFMRIELWESGYAIAAILSFGPWLIPAGILAYTSGYYHKAVGILPMIAGTGIMLEGYQHLLVPDNDALLIISGVLAIFELAWAACIILLTPKIPVDEGEEEAPTKEAEAEVG